MFNPEFRYLLFQEERNVAMMPIIYKYIMVTICVCGINAAVVCRALITSYKLFFNVISDISTYLCSTLWNCLTPGNEWFDLAIIILSSICSIVMVFTMKGMADILDNKFVKLKTEIKNLKTEIKKRNERIRELEVKVEEFELANNQ